MAVRNEVEILQQVPLFAGVQRDHLNTLAFATEHVNFKPGDVIVKEGKAPDAAYIILQGTAEVISEKDKIQEVISEIGARTFIGEAAILSNTPYRVTIQAKSKVEVLRITQKLFLRSVSEFPDMAMAIMQVLSRRLDESLSDLASVRDDIIKEDTPIS